MQKLLTSDLLEKYKLIHRCFTELLYSTNLCSVH